MPRYTPTPDDLYEITECVICGEDTGDKNKDTCSDQCDAEKSYYEDFVEWGIYQDIYAENEI